MTGSETRRAPHVLHFAQPTEGGVHRYLIDLCADQLARGWRVSAASPPGPLATDLQARGVNWWCWPATRSPGVHAVRELWLARRIVGLVDADVVHLHSSKAGLIGRLAVAGRYPTIFQPHGWSWLAARGPVRALALSWERFAVRWTQAVVCVSDGEAEVARRSGLTGPLRVVRNGVDCAHFALAGAHTTCSARYELGLPATEPVVVCPGRLTRQKGQDVLLAAWPSVRARFPTATLVLVGQGEDAARLGSAATSGVRFASSNDLRSWYAASDVVVVPSRWEGLPLVALEAAASGRPVVGSAIPGLTEVITPRTGTLVPPERPGALAEALVRLLDDPVLASRQGAAARHEAVARFDLSRTHEQLADVTCAVTR